MGAERTWPERVLATACPACGQLAGLVCVRDDEAEDGLAKVCASRIQAAEAAAKQAEKAGRHKFGSAIPWGPYGASRFECSCGTWMHWRGGRPQYSHDNGATWTPGPDACPGVRP